MYLVVLQCTSISGISLFRFLLYKLSKLISVNISCEEHCLVAIGVIVQGSKVIVHNFKAFFPMMDANLPS